MVQSVEVYIDELKRKGRQLTKSSEDVLDCLKIGLLPHIRNKVLEEAPTTLQKAIDIAVRMEQIYGEAPTVNAFGVSDLDRKLNKTEKRLNDLDKKIDQLLQIQSQPSKTSKPQCSICHKFGHLAKTCFAKQSAPPLQCGHSGRTNHTAQFCRVRQPNNQWRN
jgi:hypothetical protein